jgi:hypothetical protein
MQPHQQRVVDELSELQDKLGKLNAFIESPKFEDVVGDPEECGRLVYQRHCMQQYSFALEDRIKNFK